MLTLAQAQALGWTIEEVDGAHVASKDGAELVRIVSDCPIFFALRAISAIEDEPVDDEITPAVVAAATGEKLVEDAPPPPVAAEPSPLEAALAALPPDKTLTASELLAIIRGA